VARRTRSAKEDAFRKAQSNKPLVNVKVDGFHHNRRATRREDARREERLTARG
jgi:hypothetical protein